MIPAVIFIVEVQDKGTKDYDLTQRNFMFILLFGVSLYRRCAINEIV
jgi:hypothetical protein